MKRIFTFIVIILFFLNSYSQKERGFNSCPYDIEITTIDFIVLDINFEKNLVAFKHIYKKQTIIYQDDGEIVTLYPIDCNYTGMEENPTAGVILGIYDLENGEYLKTFTIYKSCFEKENCIKYETSAKNLDSAKQLFIDHDLNIFNKPKPTDFNDNQKDGYNISIAGIDFFSNYKNNYNEGHTMSYLYANDNLIYSIEQKDFFVMASHGEIKYTSAYTNGQKIVFLNKFFHENHIEGPRSMEFFHFTPVFDIQKLKN